MHISLTNIDNINSQQVEINLKDFNATHISGKILTSSKVQDHNTFDNPKNVVPKNFNDASISGNNIKLMMPPISVIVLELE
jgi:alpha-N-arabinofuranosidase